MYSFYLIYDCHGPLNFHPDLHLGLLNIHIEEVKVKFLAYINIFLTPCGDWSDDLVFKCKLLKREKGKFLVKSRQSFPILV
ncbi:hypothetical protein Taro_005161 [Colocasia esculenta]|uniref:Uncharacterized protein n=1 Tax=Colocasia esculenta TaxID=4460 RepID=A0A843TRM1_COLES|nr:hypothetical protein [Colocasia esculenta]